MARIRSVKPEFWTAEQVMECSPLARLAFIGMWTFCDDAGIHTASYKTLKAEVFPSDDITASQVAEMVSELIRNGLVEQYEAGGREYWAVTGWHHQKIDQPTYKHPRKDGTIPEGAPKRRADKAKEMGSPNVPGVFGEQSANVRGVFTPGVEWSGEEWSKPLNPELQSIVPDPTAPPPGVAGNETRTGSLCRQLRAIGIDASPHLAAWAEILPAFSDAEVVAAAQKARDSKPGERIHLNYLLPILRDRAPPGARESPKKNIHDQRAEAIAELTGKKKNEHPVERDITGESRRIA